MFSSRTKDASATNTHFIISLHESDTQENHFTKHEDILHTRFGNFPHEAQNFMHRLHQKSNVQHIVLR